MVLNAEAISQRKEEMDAEDIDAKLECKWENRKLKKQLLQAEMKVKLEKRLEMKFQKERSLKYQ